MKILVTGSSGFLGSNIILKKGHVHNMIGTHYSHSMTDTVGLDVSNMCHVRDLIVSLKPDVVVHSASMRNDNVEKQHEDGYRINVNGSSNVAQVCKENNIFLLYISSDLIFDGKKGRYTETDLPSPVSYFGKTKLLAEKIICEIHPKACIVRTSLLYGWDERRTNFAMMILKNLSEGKMVDVINDQYVSPSYVENVADMIIEICERRLVGTYHAAGDSRLTRYEFAIQIAKIFSLDESLIRPVSMDSMQWNTKRGKDCSLDVSLVRNILKTKPLTTVQGLEAMKKRSNVVEC